MCKLVVDKYVIDTPIIDILKQIKSELHNNKLREIKVKGDDIRVTCPVHSNGQEEHASCGIYCGNSTAEVKYGTFNCFTCNSTGPFWHFVAECFDESDEFGKEWLIERFGNKMIEKSLDLPEIKLTKNKKQFLDESILDKFQNYHPYMDKRKLSRPICERFKIKYDSNTQSLVFPVWDEYSNLVMLTRRSVNSKKFIIDEGIEKPVYLLNYIKKCNLTHCIITEGQIDALTAWTYGFPAIATIGSISNKQIENLNKSNIRVYITMFDNDDAGKRFTEKFNSNIRKDVIILNCKLPNGKKDINDLSKEEFWKCLNNIGIYSDY